MTNFPALSRKLLSILAALFLLALLTNSIPIDDSTFINKTSGTNNTGIDDELFIVPTYLREGANSKTNKAENQDTDKNKGVSELDSDFKEQYLPSSSNTEKDRYDGEVYSHDEIPDIGEILRSKYYDHPYMKDIGKKVHTLKNPHFISKKKMNPGIYYTFNKEDNDNSKSLNDYGKVEHVQATIKDFMDPQITSDNSDDIDFLPFIPINDKEEITEDYRDLYERENKESKSAPLHTFDRKFDDEEASTTPETQEESSSESSTTQESSSEENTESSDSSEVTTTKSGDHEDNDNTKSEVASYSTNSPEDLTSTEDTDNNDKKTREEEENEEDKTAEPTIPISSTSTIDYNRIPASFSEIF